MPQPYILLPALSDGPVDEWIKLAQEAQIQGKHVDAMRHYQRALKLNPNHPTATHNFAILLAQMGQLNDGLLAMERACLFDGTEPLIAANRALMCLEADRIDEAKREAERAMSLAKEKPPEGDELKKAGYMGARLAYAMIVASAGEPEKSYPAYLEMLAIDPKHPAAAPNACFVQSLMPVGPAELRAQRQFWREHHGHKGKPFPHSNVKDPNRTLRVGYVGGDFKSHSAAMMFSNVILNHTDAVEVYLYCSMSINPKRDDLTQRFMQKVIDPDMDFDQFEDDKGLEVPQPDKMGRWRNIAGKTDEDVDVMIGEDKIDILVDLAGHTNGGRLGVFTRKPAPIQVTAWGFAHGTGLPEMDYFFADPVAVPESERPHFAEKIWDLPSIVTYREPVEYGIKPYSPLPYYRNEYITLGSFSRFEKASDDYLACVRRIMQRLPNSRMMWKDHSFRRPYSMRRVLSAMDGIDKSRFFFGTSTAHAEHMQQYQEVDIYLDTYSHGAGVVALECLYVGVPIITRYGTQPAGRTASSVLTQMGRTEWITKSADEFVERVVEWANRPAELAAVRKTLRKELLESPVVKNYHLAVEDAYRKMWQEWCAK